MRADLAGLVTRAEETLGGSARTGTGLGAASVNPARPVTDNAGNGAVAATGEEADGTEGSDGIDDEAASLAESADGPTDVPANGVGEQPVRNRRTRQKVGAGA
jgi:hypothetical protein